MDEVLIARSQLAAQQLLQVFDDFGMAFHRGNFGSGACMVPYSHPG
jgi:hypothetical protein